MRVSRLGPAVACAIGLGGLPAGLRAQSDPLSLGEVLELHRRGVSARQILRSVGEYCIAFSMGDSVGRELVASGADTILVGGLRQACVIKPATPLPPGVLLDEDFKSGGQFASAEGLCMARPDARGVRIENRRPDAGCAIAYPLYFASGDIRLELTVAALSGDAPGVVALAFGKDTVSGDQYSFAITTDSHVELGETIRGRFRQLRYQKRVAIIQDQQRSENRLAVEIRGRTIDLYVNDDRVLTYLANRDLGQGISLGVGPRTSVVFTRLVAKKPDAIATVR
jgi:hypothetical protein